MKYIATAIVGLALLAVVRVQASDFAWGASTNGLSLGIVQTSDGKALNVHFRNDTSNALYVVTNSLWWHCDLLADGKRVTREDDRDDIILHKLTADSFARVESGKVLKCVLPLSHWEAIPSDNMRLRYRNTEMMRQKNNGKEFGFNVWMGAVLSNNLKMKAANKVPQDTARKLADPQH